eukprot:61982_1
MATNTTSTSTHSPTNRSNNAFDLGTIFAVRTRVYIVIGGLCICLCACVLLLCICHKKKKSKKKETAHTEVVNGMQLQYKYTKKAESFNTNQYKSSIAPMKKTSQVDSDQASFDRVVQLPNTTVQHNPFRSVSKQARPMVNTVSASPRAHVQHVNTHPSMHRQYRSDEHQSRYPVQHHHHHPVRSMPNNMPPRAHPLMSNQPQSYPYPFPPQDVRVQHAPHQQYMQKDEVFTNLKHDAQHARNPSESSSEYKTEYALTEAMTVDSNAANCASNDTGMDSNEVVDTLTTIVNQAKENEVDVIEEDREESYVLELQAVDMNTMHKDVSYGGSSIDVNREPSELTIASRFAGSTNTL